MQLQQYFSALSLIILISCSSGKSGDSSTSASTIDAETAAALGATDIQATASQMTDGSQNWQVVLQWKKSATAPSDLTYEIQRSQITKTVATKTAVKDYTGIKASPYTIKDLPPESTQYFTIKATGTYNGASASATSEEYSVKIPLDPYTKKPGSFDLTGTFSNGDAILKWTEPQNDGAAFYIIQSGLSSGSYPTTISKMPDATTRTYTVKNLQVGKKLYFMVLAVNSVGSTKATKELEILVPDHTSFTVAGSSSNNKVVLNWTAVDDATGFDIFRSSTSATASDFVKISSPSSTETSYTDNSVTNGTNYFYKVVAHTAINLCGSWGQNGNNAGTNCASLPWTDVTSNVVTASPLSAAAISSAVAGDSQVTLTWSASTGATGYAIQYGTSSGAYPSTVSSISSSTLNYTVTGLTNGTTYYFIIVALNDNGSVNSSESSASPAGSGSCGGSTWSGTKHLGTPGINAEGYPIAVDASCNVFLGGSTRGYVSGGLDGNPGVDNGEAGFIIKYDKDGTKKWTVQVGTASPGYVTEVTGLVPDTAGNLYVGGRTGGDFEGQQPIGNGDSFVTKLDSSGNKLWSTLIGDPADSYVAQAITSDNSNNVYVSGWTYTSGNAFLTKLDASGNILWTKLIGADARSYGIASDASNLYVIISTDQSFVSDSHGTFTSYGYDSYVIKYDLEGTELIVNHIGNQNTTDTEAYAVAVDTSNGDYYVTGGVDGALGSETYDSNNQNEVFIIKYNSSGTQVWEHQQGLGANGSYSYGYGLCSDNNGNAYIGGYTSGNFDGNTGIGATDMFITKFHSDGTKEWTTQKGLPDQSIYTYGIACSQSNVFVGGYIRNDGSTAPTNYDGTPLVGEEDTFVAKFDSNGTILADAPPPPTSCNSPTWAGTKHAGVAGAYSEAYPIAIDSKCNVYIAGYTSGDLDGNSATGTESLFVIKYNSNGVKLWTRQLGQSTGNTEAIGIAVDTDSNVYVTGWTQGNLDQQTPIGNSDGFVTKYDALGNRQWTTLIGGTNEDNRPTAIVSDSSNNLYISSAGGVFPDSVAKLIKMDSDGTILWSKSMGNDAYTGSLAIDSSSNIYLLIQTDMDFVTDSHGTKTMLGDFDSYVVKYNSDGVEQLVVQMGKAGLQTEAYAITVDNSNGDLYVSGGVNGALGTESYTNTHNENFAIKYNSSGVQQWEHQFGASNGYYTYGYGICNDGNGNIYIGGYTSGDLPGNTSSGAGDTDFFVAKYLSNGSRDWIKQKGLPGQDIYTYGIACDGQGNAFVTGYIGNQTASSPVNYDGTPLEGTEDTFVAKFNSSGDLL